MSQFTLFLHGFLGGPASFRGVIAALRELSVPRTIRCPRISGHQPIKANSEVQGEHSTARRLSLDAPHAQLRPASLTQLNASSPHGCTHFESLATHGAFAAEIERISAMIRDESSGPIKLVGYSMGGRIALGVAIAHPELVSHLVLISSRRGLDTEPERALRRDSDEVWARFLEQEGLETFLTRWWEQPLFQSLRSAPAPVLERELAQRRLLDPAGLAWSLRHLGLGSQPSYAEEVTRLTIPVTVVAARKDPKFLALGEQLTSELPNARLTVVNGHGHHLPIEAPEALGRAIAEEP